MHKLLKIRRRKNIRGHNAGLTLIELLVGISMGTAVLGLAFAGALEFRNLFVQDVQRSSSSQNVRAAIDIPGMDVRQVGENLGTAANFPALQVTRTNQPDSNSRLIVRQNPLVGLKICETPSSSSSTVTVAIGVTFSPGSGSVTVGSNTVSIPDDDFISLPANSDGTPLERVNNPTVAAALDASQIPGCVITADLNNNNWPDDNLEKWKNLRADNAAKSLTTQAYVFDPDYRDSPTNPTVIGKGEYFTYSGEANPITVTTNTTTVTLNPTAGLPTRTATITRYTISRSTGTWTSGSYTYPAGSSLYIVEERDYQLVNGTLQVIVNGDTTRPIALFDGLQSFQVVVNRKSGATTNTIPEDFCWQNPNATTGGGLAGTIPTPPSGCGKNNQWSQIQSVDISASSVTQGQGTTNTLLSGRFFPRSVFSF
jgi:hypothetical protein